MWIFTDAWIDAAKSSLRCRVFVRFYHAVLQANYRV